MSLPNLMKEIVQQYKDIKAGNARYGVAVVSLLGKKGFDICGYDTEKRHIEFPGDILSFRTNGRSLAAIVERALEKTSERQVLLWENMGSNGPVAGVIPTAGGRGLPYEMNSLALDKTGACYVGTCKDNSGIIARYEKKTSAKGKPELQITSQIRCDFAPYTLALSPDGIYCASNDKIYFIDKKRSSSREFAALKLPKDTFIDEIDFSGGKENSVLLALTNKNESTDVSHAHVWINEQYQPPKPVSHHAFAAAVAYGRILFFHGNKNEICMESGNQKQVFVYEKLDNIQLLRFDPAMNYLYAVTLQQVGFIPFYPKECKLLTEHKLPQDAVFSPDDRIIDVRVGEL